MQSMEPWGAASAAAPPPEPFMHLDSEPIPSLLSFCAEFRQVWEQWVSSSELCRPGDLCGGLPVLPSPCWNLASSVSSWGLCILPLSIFVVILGSIPRTPLSVKCQEVRTIQALKGSDRAWFHVENG